MGKGQQGGARTTESYPKGPGGIGGGNGVSHAGDQGSAVGLVQAVVHRRGQQVVTPILQGVDKEGNPATVEHRVGPANLGW